MSQRYRIYSTLFATRSTKPERCDHDEGRRKTELFEIAIYHLWTLYYGEGVGKKF